MPDDGDVFENLSDKEREHLESYRRAFEEEFKRDETSKKSAVKELKDLEPDFLSAIRNTVKHSNNESLKARISMWGIDKLLDQAKGNDDPMTDFLAEMAKSREQA